jgi:hypothetical protein
MNKANKTVIARELWGLVSQHNKVDLNCCKILEKQLKTILDNDGWAATALKRGVMSDLRQHLKIVRTIHDDLGDIAKELKEAQFPAFPEINFDNSLAEEKQAGKLEAEQAKLIEHHELLGTLIHKFINIVEKSA